MKARRHTHPAPVGRRAPVLRARTANGRHERGAVLAELLVVASFILLCAMAAAEIGGGYRARLTVSGSLRTTTRVVASAGRDGSADWQGLLAMRSSIAEVSLAKVDRVVVYKATATGAPTDPACLTTAVVASKGVAGQCNVYDTTVLGTATASNFTADGASACTGRYDSQWCPLSRVPETDRVGVWVQIRHAYITQFMPSTVTLTDRFVMRIEPEVG